MTLLDIDNASDDRSRPMPNTKDKIPSASIMAKGTNSVNYITPASNTGMLTGAKNGQFTIVQTGSYVTPNTVGIVGSPGAGLFGAFANEHLYTQAHGLPFIPLVQGALLAFNGTAYHTMPATQAFTANGGTTALWLTYNFTADATNIYINLDGMAYGGGWNLAAGASFKWYLLYQQPD